MKILIKINDLAFKYEKNDCKSITNINFEISKGEVVLVLGPSGSGKSTFALSLNGLIPNIIPGEMEGTVEICGEKTDGTPVHQLTQKVGIVFQDPEAQFVSLNVEDEIVFALENLCFSHDEMEKRLIEALNKVNMLDYRYREVYSLSGGEKQKILLAALIAMHPSVFIFDEPTANLDPFGTLDFFEKLKDLKKVENNTIILIEHKLDDLMEIIDRILVINKQGIKIAEGTPREIFTNKADILIREGIWMPQVVMLYYELEKNNIKLDRVPLTIPEAVESIRNLENFANNKKSNDFNEISQSFEENKENVIKIEDLSFSYGKKKVLDFINLNVNSGDFLAIVGTNGAGKTTLAKHMVNVIEPPKSKVFIDNEDISNISSKNLSKKIGYVFQNPEHQFIKDTVEEQLSFGLKLRGFSQDQIDNWLNKTLKQFDMENYRNKSPFMLSHGQKRLLSVATMLTLGQDILILDEPTFGQDFKSSTKLLSFLKSLNDKGKTIIVITHDMSLVEKYAEKVVVMNKGKIIFKGTTKDLFKRDEILERASLTLPPLLKLSKRLSHYDENLRGMSSSEEFADYFSQQVVL